MTVPRTYPIEMISTAVLPASRQNPTGWRPAEKIRVLLGVGRDGSEMTTHDADLGGQSGHTEKT